MPWQCEHCGAVHDESGEAKFGDLLLTRGTRELRCHERAVRLTPYLEGMFLDLMTGRPVSREAIVMRHSRNEETLDKGVDVRICHARTLLRKLRSTVELKTLYGLGFQMIGPAAIANTAEEVHFGDVTLNVRRRSLTCGTASAPLRPQTTRIMEDLLRSFSTPETLLIERYIGKAGDRIKNLRVQMTYIRRTLAEIESRVEIVNTRGEGYWVRMCPDHRVPRAARAGARYAPGAAAPDGPPWSAAT